MLPGRLLLATVDLLHAGVLQLQLPVLSRWRWPELLPLRYAGLLRGERAKSRRLLLSGADCLLRRRLLSNWRYGRGRHAGRPGVWRGLRLIRGPVIQAASRVIQPAFLA